MPTLASSVTATAGEAVACSRSPSLRPSLLLPLLLALVRLAELVSIRKGAFEEDHGAVCAVVQQLRSLTPGHSSSKAAAA